MSDSDGQKTNPLNPGSLLQSSLKLGNDLTKSLKDRAKNRRRFLSPAPQIYEPISAFSPSGSIGSNDSPLGSLADSSLKPLYKGSPNMGGTSKSPFASLSLFSPKESRQNLDTPQMSHEDLSEFRGLHDKSDFIQMSSSRRRKKSDIDMSETPRASWTDRTERQIEEIIAGVGKIVTNTKTEESFSFNQQDQGGKDTHERHETSLEMEEAEVNKDKERRERRERREKKEKKGEKSEDKEIEIVKEKKKKRDKEKSESSRRKKEKNEESSESPKRSSHKESSESPKKSKKESSESPKKSKKKNEETSEQSESPKKSEKESSESPKKSKKKVEETSEQSESPKKSEKESSESPQKSNKEESPKEKKKKRHSEKKEKIEGTPEEKEKSKKRKSKSKNSPKTPKTPELKGIDTLRHSQLDKINEDIRENEEERDTTKNNDQAGETDAKPLDTHEDNNMNHSIHSQHSNNSIHSEIVNIKQKLTKGFSLRKLLASKQLSSGISEQGTPQHADFNNLSLVSTNGIGTFTSLNNLIQLHPSRSDENPNPRGRSTESLQLADRVDKKTRKSKKEITFREEKKLSRKSTKEHKEHKETKDKKEKKHHRNKSTKSSKTFQPAVPGSSDELIGESDSLLNKSREVLATDGLDLVKLLFNRLHRKKTKFLVIFFTMAIIGTFVLNSLELSDLINTTCEAQTIFGLSYLGFILMVVLKISCISLLNLELTFQQPYKSKARLAYPFLAFFISPLLQVPQNVYSFETCKSQSRIINLEQSWKFLGAAIASLVCASLFFVFRKKIKLELSKVSLVSRCWSLVSKLLIGILGLTFVAWNVMIFVLFVGQRPNVSGNLIYEVLVSIILAGSLGMFWLGKRLLGDERVKGLFIKEEEKEMEDIVVQAGEEEKEKLEIIKEEKEDAGGTKYKEENDLEKIEIHVN